MVKVLLSFICIKHVIFSIIFCHGFKEVLASTDCNFDDDLCGWENEKGADFEWIREYKYTPSSKTGPLSDHTTEEDGHYIYIEASDQDKGDKARLRSPVQSSGPYCLIFWYNMYGKDMGTLNIYIKLNDSSKTILLTRDRNLGNRNWRKAVINYNANDTHQIVIEGIPGDGSKSDIAVDDISMIHGWCSVDCNFDIGLCDWIQDDLYDFDWALQKGPTFTNNTGPESDHTTGTGQYIYMETTRKSKNEIAAVVSPLQISGKYCFSFWYYMYGAHVGNLKVELWFEDGTIETVFLRQEDQGRKWIQHNGFINSGTNFQIVFEGRVKNATWNLRNQGDIAIDDVLLMSCHDCDNPTPNQASANSRNFTYGSEIEIKCDEGYHLIGESKMVCQAGGSWSVSRPTCEHYDCGNRTIPNGNFVASYGTTFGKTASQGCKIGYTIVGDTDVVCTASGWNGTIAICTLVGCGNWIISHTRKLQCYSRVCTFGQIAALVCDVSYTTNGDTTDHCASTKCGNRTIPNGKFYTPGGTTFGQTGIQACNSGYTLFGKATVICTHSGWNGTSPSCTIADVDLHEKSTVIIVSVALVSVSIFAIALVLAVVILKKRKQHRDDDTYHMYSEPDAHEMTCTSHDNEAAKRPSSAKQGKRRPVTANEMGGRNGRCTAKDIKVSYVNQVTLNDIKVSFERSSDHFYEMLHHAQASGSDYTTIDHHDSSNGNSNNADGNYELLNKSEIHEDEYRTLQI